MKKYSINILFLFCILFALSVPFGQAEVINKVIAIINSKIITYTDLMRMLYPLYLQYQKVYTRSELEKKLSEARNDVLNQLIENELILQEAKKAEDITIPEKEVKEYVANIIKNYPSEEIFLKNLEQEKMSLKDFESSVRDQILVKKLTAKQVSARVMITPEDIKKKYEEDKEKYVTTEEYHPYHILVKKTGDALQDEEKRKMLESSRGSLSSEESFQDLAKKISEGPNRDSGGDMGFLKKGTLIKELDADLDTLKVGEVSPVIDTEIGYHLLFLKAKKKQEYIPLDQVWEQIKMELFSQRADEIRKKWIQELKEKAFIRIIDE